MHHGNLDQPEKIEQKLGVRHAGTATNPVTSFANPKESLRWHRDRWQSIALASSKNLGCHQYGDVLNVLCIAHIFYIFLYIYI